MIENNSKLSELIWGVNWKNYLPCSLGSSDYKLVFTDSKEFFKLKKSELSFLITSEETTDQFLKEINKVEKNNYLENVSDFFIIKKNQVIVGLVICELMDWSTYYLRYIFLDPNHRGQELTKSFVIFIEKILSNFNVDKLVCEISPINSAQIIRMSELGFICTGNTLSERFGTLIKFTKFLKPDPLKVFGQQFTQSYRKKISSEKVVKLDT